MSIPAPGSLAGTNLSILVGSLNRPPELRALPSGDQLVALDVTVHPPGAPSESVPVAWPSAPAAAAGWQPGEEVLVVGRVRRRFFRSGGVTQSRTEVVASVAVPTRRAAQVRRAVRNALAAIDREL